MKLEEMFQRLSFGEFSNLSLGSDGSGEIQTASHPKIIQYLNQGLLDLHKRFILKEKQLIIEQVAHISSYKLLPDYAESSESTQKYKYIKDLPHTKFTGDAIKILQVFDEHGREQILNDIENPESLFTPQPLTLQVPYPIAGFGMSVAYQAKNVPILASGTEMLHQEIDVPVFLETALQLFVAHKTYSHMNGPDNLLKSQEYFAAFQAECDSSLINDYINATRHTSHDKLHERGFV